MIEYSNSTNPNLMYVSGDGNWGGTDDIVILDLTELDTHILDVMESVAREYDFVRFARWYAENQTHDQDPTEYTPCQVCEYWQSGTEEEILESLEGN